MSDLMQYLYEAYRNEQAEAAKKAGKVVPKTKKKEGDIEKFCEFCRGHLQAVPPVGVYSAMRGVGLKLSDGNEVPVLSQEVEENKNFFMPVTKPMFNPATHGVSDTRSKNVFGKD